MSIDEAVPEATMNAADVLLGPALAAGLGDRPAILAGDETVTYRELDTAARRCGNAPRSLGVTRQDRVVLVLDDRPTFFFAYLGAMMIGAVPVALSLRVSPGDLAAIVTDSACPVVIAERAYRRSVDEGLTDVAAPPIVICIDEALGGRAALPDLMAAEPAELDAEPMLGDEMALWMYTSGTTGVPKGVVHLQRSIATAERYLGSVYGIGPEDRLYCSSKLFFAFSLGHCLLAGLRLGAAAVLNPGWPSPESVAATVERHRPSMVFSVPTMYRNLLAEGLAGEDAFAGVRTYIAAGEHMPAQLIEKWQMITGRPVLEGIGSTENLMMFLANTPGDDLPGSTGKPLPQTDVRLMAEDGEEIMEAGIPGELWVSSPSVAAGYWNRDEASARAFVDGWVRTGDFFVRDVEGRYYHQGRADDMLKISGQWVSPAEIEECVLKDPRVRDAAVVGVENEEGLVRLALFLVAEDEAPSHEKLEADLTAALTSSLSIYKCPRRIVHLDDLPRTATGKVQRFRLRQIAKDQVAGRR